MNSRGRLAYVVLAVVAWVGLALGVFVTFSGLYPTVGATPSSFTGTDAGLVSGIVDYLSYFTHVSNIVVAVVATMLARNPARRGRIFDIVALDALVMMTVTAIVYNVLLAPGAPPLNGWERPSSDVQHIITPILTLVVFLGWGPRRRWTWRSPIAALIIPVIYGAWTLVHGAVVGAYPYGILDVVLHGYPAVLITIGMIMVLGILLGYTFLGLDRLLSRSKKTSPLAEQTSK